MKFFAIYVENCCNLNKPVKVVFFKKEKQVPKFPRAIKIRIKCFANLGIYRAKLQILREFYNIVNHIHHIHIYLAYYILCIICTSYTGREEKPQRLPSHPHTECVSTQISTLTNEKNSELRPITNESDLARTSSGRHGRANWIPQLVSASVAGQGLGLRAASSTAA